MQTVSHHVGALKHLYLHKITHPSEVIGKSGAQFMTSPVCMDCRLRLCMSTSACLLIACGFTVYYPLVVEVELLSTQLCQLLPYHVVEKLHYTTTVNRASKIKYFFVSLQKLKE